MYLKELKQSNKITSVYIHIPFCKKICSYCDFCKIYYNEKIVSKYLESLEKEILSIFRGEVLDTLYVGGGTPSCLENLDDLFLILEGFSFNDTYEFTFECNIEDITKELLVFLKSKRVNRLSIGVQSFNKDILNLLGRSYDFDIVERINLCKEYFSNINIDLMYGINGQSFDDLKFDLDKFILLDVNHISIYSLILENNTILKINNYKEIDEDLNRDMYDYICNFLKNNGYIHYEISNFSKNKYFSLHNLNYWYNNKYYGFGLGASGYIDNIRYSNTKSLNNYNKLMFRLEEDIISKRIDMENFMILGLRKINGVSNKDFYNRYGKNIEDIFNVSKLREKDGFYYIDYNDLYISNSILSDFIELE